MEKKKERERENGRVEIARRASARRRSCSNHGDTANQVIRMILSLTARVDLGAG